MIILKLDVIDDIVGIHIIMEASGLIWLMNLLIKVGCH
jgi:hypothetical protein